MSPLRTSRTFLRALTLAALVCGLLGSSAADAAGSATLASAKGDVKVRAPKAKSYAAIQKGADVADGSRLKVGDDGEAVVRFADGTETTVRAKTEIIVRAPAKDEKQPAAAVVFFGRVWSNVAKASGGQNSFEVRSANAVAGVRGTKFEVGVADDGSTRVVVSEGTVAVEGEDAGEVPVGGGYEVESDSAGKLEGKKKAAKDADWAGWFSKRAKQLEKNGLAVAKSLDGRLNAKKAKVEKLVKQQKALRQTIERLEADKAKGADTDAELQQTLEELERVTARLEDMKQRLEGSFGLFERWNTIAQRGGMQGGGEVQRMAADIAKIAADFADMIEEGTDQSEEGMDELMDEMKDVKGAKKKNRPKDSAGDELFR
ncbi:FecR domain-containing protein [Myxococcota bacterium]|nr:FecR domain-containing protein [Myxococcota bacterium]